MEVFRAVMLTGSINGASKMLFISQPAVSRIISHTEQTLTYPLFNRTKAASTAAPTAPRRANGSSSGGPTTSNPAIRTRRILSTRTFPTSLTLQRYEDPGLQAELARLGGGCL